MHISRDLEAFETLSKAKIAAAIGDVLGHKTKTSDTERTFCGCRRVHVWESANYGKCSSSDIISIRSNYNLRGRIMGWLCLSLIAFVYLIMTCFAEGVK